MKTNALGFLILLAVLTYQPEPAPAATGTITIESATWAGVVITWDGYWHPAATDYQCFLNARHWQTGEGVQVATAPVVVDGNIMTFYGSWRHGNGRFIADTVFCFGLDGDGLTRIDGLLNLTGLPEDSPARVIDIFGNWTYLPVQPQRPR